MIGPASQAQRVYRRLLRLYPVEFRDRYADEMAQLFTDQIRDARSGHSGRGVARTWLATLGDLAATSVAEHARRDRTVAHSLTASPSVASRMLGLTGIVGGLILVSAFLFFIPGTFNTIRLVLFNLGAIAIAVGVSRLGRPSFGRGSLAVVGVVILSNAWYAGLVLVGTQLERPFAGTSGLLFFWAALAMWGSDGLFGLLAMRFGGLARLGGLALALGSFAIFGIDRLGLVQQGETNLASVVGLAGAALNGVGWIVLGVVVATRGRATADAPAANP